MIRGHWTRSVAALGASALLWSMAARHVADAATATATLSMTPATLLSDAIADGNAHRSVHYVASLDQAGERVQVVGDVGHGTGRQQVVVRAGARRGSAELRLVGGLAYVRADAVGLQMLLGFGAAAATRGAGRWISVSHTDPSYTGAVSGVTLASTLAEIDTPGVFSGPATTVSYTAVRRIGGRLAVGIRAHASSLGASISGVLYLELNGSPLPISEALVAVKGNVTDRVSIAFSRWDEPLTVARPTTATAAVTVQCLPCAR